MDGIESRCAAGRKDRSGARAHAGRDRQIARAAARAHAPARRRHLDDLVDALPSSSFAAVGASDR
jgi:hypothetical protein